MLIEFVFAGSYATIGVSKIQTDNTQLADSVIAKVDCTNQGSTDVDSDLIKGVGKGLGYSKASCKTTAKDEILAQELFGCSFTGEEGGLKRCSATDSARFFRSFVSSNNASTEKVQTMNMDSKPTVKDSFNKPCPQECRFEKFVLQTVFTS